LSILLTKTTKCQHPLQTRAEGVKMKIPVDQTTRSYELTYLVSGDKTSAQVLAVETAVKRLLKKQSITVVTEEDWGKRPLAYSIKHAGAHQKEAYYKHLVLDASPAVVPTFEKDLYLNAEIMRHLLVLADEAGSDMDEIQEERHHDDDRDESRY
jgi:ribosomal protein S6